MVKLLSKDIVRVKSEIRYLVAQNRYLAFEAEFVARLPGFAEMR